MSAKLTRLNKIKELLQSEIISSQEELAELLRKESIEVTQATLSRDLAELGVIRMHTDTGMRYMINMAESGQRVAKLIGYEIVSISSNESCVVVRTLAGRAMGVAQFIDRSDRADILGTVAGDDTVLIIPDSHESIPKIVAYVKQLAQET